MSGNEQEPELTKAISLGPDVTGVIPVTGGPETGELGQIDPTKIADLASGSAHLVVRRGALEGMLFPLSTGELVTIGRASDSKVFLDDVTVSRKHATASYVGTDWILSDAGSLNGTYVNKNRVISTALINGDEIQIGKFRFVFVLATTTSQ